MHAKLNLRQNEFMSQIQTPKQFEYSLHQRIQKNQIMQIIHTLA